jgi:hypothetical protein
VAAAVVVQLVLVLMEVPVAELEVVKHQVKDVQLNQLNQANQVITDLEIQAEIQMLHQEAAAVEVLVLKALKMAHQLMAVTAVLEKLTQSQTAQLRFFMPAAAVVVWKQVEDLPLLELVKVAKVEAEVVVLEIQHQQYQTHKNHLMLQQVQQTVAVAVEEVVKTTWVI